MGNRKFLIGMIVCLLSASILYPFPTSSSYSLLSDQHQSIQDISSDSDTNIMMIYFDDLDVLTMDQMLASHERMEAIEPGTGLFPNISRLTNHSVEFTNAFVTHPICCPSRRTMLTGKYSHNAGKDGVAQDIANFESEHTTIAELINDKYDTAFFGKYANKLEVSNATSGWDQWAAYIRTGYAAYTYFSGTMHIASTGEWSSTFPLSHNQHNAISGTTYQNDYLGSISTKFINDSQTVTPQKPFFLLLAPTAPHVGLITTTIPLTTVDDFYKTKVPVPANHLSAIKDPNVIADFEIDFDSILETARSDKPKWIEQGVDENGASGQAWKVEASDRLAIQEKQYSRVASMISADTMIGNLWDTLTATGQLTKTAIILTSDNGYMLGHHHLVEKRLPYEESIRVPLYVKPAHVGESQPARQSPLLTRSQIVLSNDLAPTIADYAGMSNSTFSTTADGRSFRSLVDNPDPSIPWSRKRFLIDRWVEAMPIINGKVVDFPTYAAVRTDTNTGTTSNQLFVEYYGIRDAGTPYRTIDVEHYLQSSDPYQHDNRYKDLTLEQERQILSAHLSRLRMCSGQSCRDAEDALDASVVETNSISCVVINGFSIAPTYDTSGTMLHYKQTFFAGGGLWERISVGNPTAQAPTWGAWKHVPLHLIWGSNANRPPLYSIEDFAQQTLYNSNGAPIRMRQLVYGWNEASPPIRTLWWRDFIIGLSTSWPTTWSSKPYTQEWSGLNAPNPNGSIAAMDVYNPVVQNSRHTVQVVYAQGKVHKRSSPDGIGLNYGAWTQQTYASAFGTNGPPGVDAATIRPMYDSQGNIAHFKEIIIYGNQLWERLSSDATASTWGSWTVTGTTLNTLWGGPSQHWNERPPVSCN